MADKEMKKEKTVRLNVNGKDYELQIEPQWTLQRTLRFKLGLTDAKTKCDRGVCGSCTVIMLILWEETG
jgi:aerobic-type carbon monoxide dehydrogenase small subunit (CoxS/CutS family)